MQMKLEACKNECKWWLRCNHCIVNNCPEGYCPPMHLPIPPDYAKNLIEIKKMVRNGVLPPTIKTVYKTRYPLACAEPKSSGDDHIVNDYLETLADGQEEERSPSPLPCAEPESSEDD